MPAIPRNTKAKSSTLYLSEDVLARINQFAEATVRSKTQSAEYLIRIGMDQFLELGTEEPADAPAPARAKSAPMTTKAWSMNRSASCAVKVRTCATCIKT